MGSAPGAPVLQVLSRPGRYLTYFRRIILTLRPWLVIQQRASGKIISIMSMPPLTTGGAQTLGG